MSLLHYLIFDNLNNATEEELIEILNNFVLYCLWLTWVVALDFGLIPNDPNLPVVVIFRTKILLLGQSLSGVAAGYLISSSLRRD